MGSQLQYTATSVKKNLTAFGKEYEPFFKNLEKANDTFGAVNTYWLGPKYEKIMNNWNKVVPELNKQLDALALASESLNGVFRAVTDADSKAITLTNATRKKLTKCTVKKYDENEAAKIDTARLHDDLESISKSIADAKSNAEKMKGYNEGADWSSDPKSSIYNVKSDTSKVLSQIITSLSNLSKDVKDVLTETKDTYETAAGVYGGKK